MFKTTKGQETRERIYAAAMALFRERGFENATMRDIAAAAGMSLGAAYHYFDGKDAIVLKYYQDIADETERRVRPALATGGALGERLRIPLHTKIDIVQADRPLMGALLRYAGQPDHPLSFLGDATRSLRQRNMALYSEALGDTPLPDETRVLAPLALWSLEMGILLFFLYDRSARQRRTRALIDGSVDLFIAALKLNRLPGFGAVRRKVSAILAEAGLLRPDDTKEAA